VEDNPHLSEDGQTLYFDSNRSDINGTTCIDESGGLERSIYVSEFDGGTWSRPAGIQGIPNESAFAWQVFVRQEGLYIYWSGECTGGISCLFRARRLPNGSYGEETLIAQAETLAPSPGDVIAVGEMSITAAVFRVHPIQRRHRPGAWYCSSPKAVIVATRTLIS
jgi:hypothetical protein